MKGATLPRMHENTIEDYVRYEESVETKHEYVYGSIIAMAGGTPNHAALIAQVIAQLGGAAINCDDCRVFSSELRIRIANERLILYPDVTVVCGTPRTDTRDTNALVNPQLIVEVTSPATARYDRGKKYGYYQRLQTLREYVLVSHSQPLIEVFRRTDDGTWVLREEAASGQLRLAAMNAVIDVDRLYAGLEL